MGLNYLTLAALILLLLPAVVLPWEGRRVPDWLYGAIGAGGIVAGGLQGGSEAALIAGVIGLTSFALITGIITIIRISLNLRILTGGHIKLMATGAMWLGVTGALAMWAMAFGGLFLVGAVRKVRATARRPDFSTIAALAILCVGVQQALPPARTMNHEGGHPVADEFRDR